MKFITSLVLALTVLSTAAFAEVYVDGYTRKDGTYVQPHYRSSPDSTPNNNWSTQGNINPHTGAQGTKPRQPEYGSFGNNNSGSLNPSGNDDSSYFGD